MNERWVLLITYKTGILGSFKVSEISLDGAIAEPLQGFDQGKPIADDELILPP
jgi:hypothetical protein